ncbi:MAG TPA: bifunctional riboflavin kinase/FAD synthetase [Candidatus Acidoferrales bacterium]|nr:bifunctional riboflavin kinase/FAD synthetase [Candidatus Acidoferrales bacterium]
MAIAKTWSTEEWVERFGAARKQTAVTIGNFDGVHVGHQAILRRVCANAHAAGRMSAVLTFYPHPAQVLRPAEAPALLETIDQRLARLEGAGMDAVLVARFNRELASLSPEEFAEAFLANTMRAGSVFVGENFRFGHRQAGNVNLLRELGARLGFEVEIVAPVYEEIGGKREVVSSSAIRAAVRDGRMDEAADMLGRAFALEGEIRTGTGLGRKLVVPTLNLATEQEMLPKLGVYATETAVGGAEYRSVTNVGMRPTFDGAKLAIETHLFGFNGNLTSGPMAIRFRARIRDEKKFSGPQELKEQILRDIETAKEYFQESTPQS